MIRMLLELGIDGELDEVSMLEEASSES